MTETTTILVRERTHREPPEAARFRALWDAARAAHDCAKALDDAALTARTREAVQAIARAVARYQLCTGSSIVDWSAAALEIPA